MTDVEKRHALKANGWKRQDLGNREYWSYPDPDRYGPCKMLSLEIAWRRHRSGLSVRARKLFLRLGCTCAADLASRTEAELLRTKNVGWRTVAEVRAYLREHGLRLKGGAPDGDYEYTQANYDTSRRLEGTPAPYLPLHHPPPGGAGGRLQHRLGYTPWCSQSG